MDTFRADAEQLLQNLLCKEPTDGQYHVLDIRSSLINDKDTKLEDKTFDDAALRNFIECPKPTNANSTTTRIVHLYYHQDRGVTSASSVFQHTWRSFNLEPYMMYMAQWNVPGFFQLPCIDSPSGDHDRFLKFHANCQAHFIMWTYDTKTLSTDGVLLSRDSPGGPAAYPTVHSHLKRYSGLSGHPLYLALMFALEKIAYIDRFLKIQHKRIGRAEKYTGFSHFHIDKPLSPILDAEEALNQLSDHSRLASSVLVGLADMMQHLQSSEMMLDAILSFELPTALAGINGVVKRDVEIRRIAKLLEPQLKQRFNYVNYIKQRAENQLTVIFNLLARGDAQTTISIARSTMHDSTSMKTIAVMTMGFLPATFWAALFSVPSLHWDQPTVISSRFWVYWAFTIPTTISVFLAWLLIMNRNALWARMKGRRRLSGSAMRPSEETKMPPTASPLSTAAGSGGSRKVKHLSSNFA
ncbi:hypothetical protein LTR84_000586 [Exophiala bonariae]|uniref:Mg2+ transporter protein, CorA-like/Zinc transport protein ZntB n=1 Tax=Exophiala bonariae TaxID=1690606 RepID=A0AAV9NRB1_9EURO|nr:hypothetical protein LTR84_000586 [Exophiala bonariae]